MTAGDTADSGPAGRIGDTADSATAAAPAAARAAVESFARLHAAGDATGCAALLAPAAVMRSTLAEGTAEGRDAVERMLAAGLAGWSERRETVTAVVADAASGGIESVVEGSTAAGRAVTVAVVTALGLEGDSIASIRVYADTTPFSP